LDTGSSAEAMAEWRRGLAHLLAAAGLLAIPMSIPILNWLAMAFRAPLLQALLIAGCDAAAGGGCATGAVPAWAGAVPGLWSDCSLPSASADPVYLRRIQAANAQFERLHPATGW
jgi:hypothetical protein